MYIMGDECKLTIVATYIHACVATYLHMDVCLQLCADLSGVSYSIQNHACMHIYDIIILY